MSVAPIKPGTKSAISKPPWDKRSWLVGCIGSIVLSVLALPGFLDLKSFNSEMAEGMSIFSALGAFIILPSVLAGIAKRRWLLWPYLPPLIWFVLVLFGSVVQSTSASGGVDTDDTPSSTMDMTIGIVVICLAPIISAMPVILFRWISANRKRAVERFELDNQFAPEVEGVWPPRPTGGDD